MCRSFDARWPLALALLLWLTALAQGAEDPDVLLRQHIERAQLLYGAREYAAAIDELSAAYAIRPLPRLLLNIARAYRVDGKEAQAQAAYQRYREQNPAESAEDRAAWERLAPPPRAPPPVVLAPTPLARPAPVAAPPARRGRRWVWVLVAGVAAAAAVGTGLALGLSTSEPATPRQEPSTTLGIVALP